MPLAEKGYGLLPVVKVPPEALAGFDCDMPLLNESSTIKMIRDILP